MFTGIVGGLGEIIAAERKNRERRFSIRPLFVMENIEDGESIAVNGVCLSVEEHGGGVFRAYASAETIDRSNLGELTAGAKVNLERALKLGERLGGHIVSGHIDCVATVAVIARQGQSLRIRLTFPPRFGPLVIPKGSISLNGVSLTVNLCGTDFLEVNIIPDSQKRSNICQWRQGDKINMETDIIGKYVQNMLKPRPGRQAASRDFLEMHGFMQGESGYGRDY